MERRADRRRKRRKSCSKNKKQESALLMHVYRSRIELFEISTLVLHQADAFQSNSPSMLVAVNAMIPLLSIE